MAKGGSNDIPEEEGAWDCSVCTFKNKAEAFKCSMCDVRKGTSTRKPRINPDLVAASGSSKSTGNKAPQAGSSSMKDHDSDESEEDKESEKSDTGSSAPAPPPAPVAPTPPKAAKKSTAKKSSATNPDTPTPKKSASSASKAKLKNVDRSSATYHSVTVDDFTVVITEFKPKIKKSPVKSEKNSDSKNGDQDKKTDQNGAAGSSDIKLETPTASAATASSINGDSSRTS